MLFFLSPSARAQTTDITPTAISFGPVLVEESLTRTLAISNTAGITITVTPDITGTDSAAFALAPAATNGCAVAGQTLGPNTGCILNVIFTPVAFGVYTAAVEIVATEAVTTTYTVPITGTGVYEVTATAFEGTYGTEIVYGGGTFGDKKGKIYIANNKQKIDSWVNAQITMVFNKFKDMLVDTPYDVSIEPKGTAPIVLPNAFTLRKPLLDAATYTGSPEQEVTLTGMWFGTKKGKVYIEGRKCKIKEWNMNPTTGESTVTFIVHKKVGAGTFGLEVENKIGRAAAFITVN
jgi:hypothetical protein